MLQRELGTCDWLLEQLTRHHLRDRGQLEPIVAGFLKKQPFADASALAEHLIARGLLSSYQARKALDGEARALVFGPYEVVDTLGSGSMGTVYKALGRADRLGYALKVVPLRNALNVRLARRQVKEYADLSHPALVSIVDVGTAGNSHYLVWPLATGEPLKVRVRRDGRLDPVEAVRIGILVAEGLRACHQAGLFHGLLKPSNVMLCPDGSVRLLDCGLGALLAEDPEERLVDTMSSAQAVAGMLDFLAPECSLDPSNGTPSADLYSLGCLLYYCLSGHCPFADSSAYEKLLAHQKQTPPPLRMLNPEVPEALAAAVERLMQKAPAFRYGSAGELIRSLQRVFARPARPGTTPTSRSGLNLPATSPTGRSGFNLPATTSTSRSGLNLPATNAGSRSGLNWPAPNPLPAPPPPPRPSLWQRLLWALGLSRPGNRR